jgi:ATP-dependent protease ClpP protease subunit
MNKKENNIMDMLALPKPKGYFTQRTGASIHDFYLSGTVEPAEEYVEWFEIIRRAAPTDVIRIHINSYGGDLFSAIQMVRVLNECEATVITSVEGACMSAATMIFLNADIYEVSEHSMFMFHNYSAALAGKGGEMFDQLSHERVWSEKMLQDIYKDFLTQKEIQSILNNKDIWMDGDQVLDRLEAKAKKLEKKSKKIEKESNKIAKQAQKIAKEKSVKKNDLDEYEEQMI